MMTMITMNNKQIKLLEFCGFIVEDDKITIKEDEKSLTTILFEPLTGFFTLKIKNHRFVPNDYYEIEKFSIDLNRKLSLIYELNNYLGGDNNVCS